MVYAKTNRLVWRAISTKTGSSLIDVQKEKKVDKHGFGCIQAFSSRLGILIHGASGERRPVNFVFNIRSCPDAVSNPAPYASIMAPGMDPSVRRTFMTQERTFMASIRISVSLISFGSSIHRFFDYPAKAAQAPGVVKLHL
jgi:Domain of unknown function (DUF202)